MMLDFGFYNMDCLEGMKKFPDKYFQLAICDPPYGINIGSEPGGATNSGYRSEEEEANNSDRRSNSVRKQIRVGGGSASRPKHTRHSMTATYRVPCISKNCGVYQNTKSSGAGITSLTILERQNV